MELLRNVPVCYPTPSEPPRLLEVIISMRGVLREWEARLRTTLYKDLKLLGNYTMFMGRVIGEIHTSFRFYLFRSRRSFKFLTHPLEILNVSKIYFDFKCYIAEMAERHNYEESLEFC